MNPIPYGFLPIDVKHAVHDSPVWRDGSGAERLLSGELLLTLEALAPLIVGNHQYKADARHSVLTPQMLDDGRVVLGAASLKGMLRAAEVLALTAVRAAADPALLRAARAEWKKSCPDGYRCPMPAENRPEF